MFDNASAHADADYNDGKTDDVNDVTTDWW